MAAFPNSLTTERLSLRRAAVTDADAVLAYASDPETAHYMTFPVAQSIDDVLPFLESIQPRMDAGTEFHWAIRTADQQSMIGMITLRDNPNDSDFGWILHRSHWGNGYMPEAAAAVVQWCFDVAGAWRVAAVCDVDNENSARVMQKVGMQQEGVLRRWITHPNISSEPRDAKVFSIVR